MGSCRSILVSSEHQISSPSLSQSNNSDVGKENQYQNQNPQQPPVNQLEGPVLKLKQGFTKNKKPKGDTNYGLCPLNPHANFQKNIQPLQEEPVTEKFREKIDYSSEIYTRKKDDFTRYYSIINENKMNEVPNNQKSIKYQLFLQKQPGKDYLLEPNSFYEGYFDVEKQIKYNYGKIILKQYDSYFNQSFFTYEGPFVKNKCKGKNGKQFYGKSNVIQFEGEWNSQGRLEATGKFYDGAGTQIPNPNPKPQPNRKIKIISITNTKTGSSIQQQTLPQSWCAFDQLYYEKDLKILEGTGWLNSSIIDGYIYQQFIQMAYKRIKKPKDFTKQQAQFLEDIDELKKIVQLVYPGMIRSEKLKQKKPKSRKKSKPKVLKQEQKEEKWEEIKYI